MGDSNELRALIRETSEQNAARVAQVEAQVQDLTRQLREFISVMGGTNGRGTDTRISGNSSRLNTATGPEERLELRQTGGMVPRSKFSFGEEQVAYLCHVISVAGVAVDTSKISAILHWPPTSIKALRGFLGLAGYYQKFICNYGQLANPLTSLLKKNSFHWIAEAATSFDALKTALSQAPVLQLPNFDDEFIIECDASGVGIGAVLQ
ncbi:hypothetical protein GH714_021460 [Hevea brasiliensis]|uniref:Reverse transcriptase/retrotransposon-derived protein RNase H-like domain-containing protein n=1 Tax=Hevea brasiliensis TaxID=3981 RepID=A0A6A6LQK0_HEVBR|nr:hypothetical protein GH714_021460 [Hevea brasiliensis]